MPQSQSNITSFITPSSTPSPNTPHEDMTQHLKKRPKLTRKKTSWIWAHFIEDLNDSNEPVIVCQVIKEDGAKCNIKLKHDGSTGNGSSHLWSVHKLTKDGKQSEVQYLNQQKSCFLFITFASNNLIY